MGDDGLHVDAYIACIRVYPSLLSKVRVYFENVIFHHNIKLLHSQIVIWFRLLEFTLVRPINKKSQINLLLIFDQILRIKFTKFKFRIKLTQLKTELNSLVSKKNNVLKAKRKIFW